MTIRTVEKMRLDDGTTLTRTRDQDGPWRYEHDGNEIPEDRGFALLRQTYGRNTADRDKRAQREGG